MTLFNQFIVWTLPLVPKAIIRLVSRRYVAGESLDEMLGTVKRLNAEASVCTVDLLGEFITDIKQAHTAASRYKEILDVLHQADVQSGVSIKLTALGLLLDKETCFDLIQDVVAYANTLGSFVRIDMEDSPCTTDTINIYLRLRKGYQNVGIVLQAYMRRTLTDMREISQAGAGDFRLCKGIYIEPRELAYKDPETVNKNYALVLEEMFKEKAYVGIATHDEKLVWEALKLIDAYGLEAGEYEFQMLLGVDEQLRSILLDAGHKVRIYVPFGKQWYAYSMRRLKENPTIAGHVFKSFWRRLFGTDGSRQKKTRELEKALNSQEKALSQSR